VPLANVDQSIDAFEGPDALLSAVEVSSTRKLLRELLKLSQNMWIAVGEGLVGWA
jgi:hypothetical protein